MSKTVALNELRGLVATVCFSGDIKHQFGSSLSNLRSWNDRNGYHAIEYRTFSATLVESGRDAVVSHAIKEDYQWVLQIDADAAPFPENATEHMLKRLYGSHSHLGAIGAYCQLKQPPHLPTIDTGTGRWEEHYPNEGVLNVIRTGCHFLMTKTEIFKIFGPPWFRSRLMSAPFEAMLDTDNFFRVKLDGKNPLVDAPEWNTMLHQAASDQHARKPVGEDSSFCDTMLAAGLQIGVDTDLVVGHVADKVILPNDYLKNQLDAIKRQRQSMGVR